LRILKITMQRTHFDRELAELCGNVALDVLDAELDAELDLFRFAVATITQTCRSENVNHESLDADLFLGGILRRVGQSDVEREAEFIADFIDGLFSAPLKVRSNGRKVSAFNILCAAAAELEIKNDEPDPSLHSLIASAEFHLFIEPDEEAFRKTICRAFEIVVKRPNFSLEELAAAIRQAQADADIRALRAKLGLGTRHRALPSDPDTSWPNIRVRGKRA
jgi:hypothetical protein